MLLLVIQLTDKNIITIKKINTITIVIVITDNNNNKIKKRRKKLILLKVL